jgi:hypothetical protein
VDRNDKNLNSKHENLNSKYYLNLEFYYLFRI